jgi:hypothetical protein
MNSPLENREVRLRGLHGTVRAAGQRTGGGGIRVRRVASQALSYRYPGRDLLPAARMRLITCLAFLLLLAPAAAAAQEPPAVVTGRVMLLDSMRGAARALVRIESLNVGASTDSTGRYRLVVPARRIPAGDSVSITVSRMGLHAQSRQVLLAPGSEARADFEIKVYRPDRSPCAEFVFGTGGGRVDSVELCNLPRILARKGFPRLEQP